MDKQTRVLLWGLPRSRSTAILKCMSGVPNSKMFYEPYTTAFLFGPDRPSDDAPRPDDDSAKASGEGVAKDVTCAAISGFEDSICSYKWVKDQLEAPHEGKQLIFCKDMAYCLDKKYEFLPRGYRYVFLIRNPAKVIPSWKKLISDFTRTRVEDFVLDELRPPVMPSGIGYGELLELYDHVKKSGLDREPVVIDADELVADPAAVLSVFCQKVGVQYTDDLFTWDEGGGVVETWAVSKNLKVTIKDLGSFDNVKKSSCFKKPEVAGAAGHDKPPLSSPDIQRFVDMCVPLYTKLYENRLK